MSDSVVKAGIEDVLSSIKRLVSEEGRTESKAGSAVDVRKPGRLVLTDALRIGAPVRLDEKDAVQSSTPEYSAQDSAKPMLLRACDIVRAGTPANQDRADTETSLDDAVTQQPDDAGLTTTLTGSLSAKIEALEAAIARTEDQWEPDGDSTDAYSGTPTKAVPWAGDTSFSQSEDMPSEPEIAESPATAPDNAPSTPDADRVSEPTVAAVQGAETIATQSKDADPDAVEPVTGPTMDEEDLRALISDIVRQELQGPLGERLTRNLRKMVRREIQRALAARNLE
ncbi:MAG: hypothetical protein AAF496_12095 [Pseudomonadota bacterium]